MADQWNFSKHLEQRIKAKKITEELRAAGHKVKYFYKLSIVRVKIGRDNWYVDTMPNIEDYGKTIVDKQVRECCNECCFIDLKYGNEKYIIINLRRSYVCICGVGYELLEESNYVGHLRENIFTCYEKSWVRFDLNIYFKYLFTDRAIPMPKNIDDLILTYKFKPVKKQTVDIQNEGFKFVKRLIVNKNSSSMFTTFDPRKSIDYIADGQYIKKRRNSLFKYKNADNEAFAMLVDPLTNRAVLASSARIVELKHAKNHIIKCVDGLYNGYIITGDYITEYIKKHGEYPKIYEYNGVYFAHGRKLIILDARAPHSGMHTKAAVTNC